MELFLYIVATILASIKQIQLMLSSQYTVGAPVWSAKDSMYIRITLFFLTALYMHIIYPYVQLDSIYGWICVSRKIETPIRV